MGIPEACILIGLLAAYSLFWLFALGSLLMRDDLPSDGKLIWVLVMIFVPFGLILYVVLGPPRFMGKINRSHSVLERSGL